MAITIYGQLSCYFCGQLVIHKISLAKIRLVVIVEQDTVND